MLTYILLVIGITGVLITLHALITRIVLRIKEKKEDDGTIKQFSPVQTLIYTTLNRLNYFKQLSSPGKEKFIGRSQKILNRLTFSAAGNIEADNEKKILIVASIVQITFGLEDYDIDSIENIKIFENNIYNPKTKVQYKGLTFTNGNMYLSWEHFLQGIKLQDDGVNLGLHETGHGLYILLKQNSAYENFDNVLNNWYQLAQHEIDHNDDGEKEFFRKYADANKEEFFAICIENFFERSLEFKKRLPEIYVQLSVLLNQDPANSTKDYIVAENLNVGQRLYLHKNRWHKSFSALIFLSYLSIAAFFIIKAYFLETFLNFVVFSIPCIILSYFLFKRYYLDSKLLSPKKYLLLCVTTISPTMLILVMVLNLLIPASSAKKITFKTIGSSYEKAFSVSQNDFAILDRNEQIYLLENNYTVPVELRKIINSNYRPREIEYTYHYGITGLKIYDGMKEKDLE